MNHSSKLKSLFAAAALIGALGASAGNIPQYSFSASTPGFEFLTDATQVKASFNVGDEMVYPDKQTLTAYTGKGFPIGFDFHYAGQTFNQFAINNSGFIMLGNDKVEFRGFCNLCFHDGRLYATNNFYLGMSPSIFGIKSGEISYKLEGEEGNRVLTVQFAHMNVNEPNTRGNAIYSEQIQLFEKDGRVTINFLEEESPYTNMGLITGLVGWSDSDTILITAASPGDKGTISSAQYADMLKGDTLIHWSSEDVLGDGHEAPYTFSYTFLPTGEENFVCDAPENLMVDQYGDTITVSCDRPANAPATVIMISDKPITELPAQGVTYPVLNDKGEYITKLGDATLIYYNNGENPSASFSGLKSSTRYYIKAFGVNGYPSYATESSADAEFVSSHAAPYVIQATSADKAIEIKTVGDFDVIIAETLDRVNNTDGGTTGIFGMPADGCKVGDEIEGGGKIIYIGAPGDFTYNEAVANRQVFFRAWSLNEDRISKTFINASGVTNPEMPYKPELELYTLYQPPLGWIAQTTSESATIVTNFIPRFKGEKEDVPCLGGISAGTVATLVSPELPVGKNGQLTFEWSLETTRDMSDQADALVQLPEGREPGIFGTGHNFQVSCGARGLENVLFTASEYTGSMVASPTEQDRYISGTSEMLPVTVTLPVDFEKGRIAFRFSTESESILYLRNIVVTGEGAQGAVENIFMTSGEDMISGGEGTISVLSAQGGDYTICSIDGKVVARFALEAGEGRVIPAATGIYVVNNQKVMVK